MQISHRLIQEWNGEAKRKLEEQREEMLRKNGGLTDWMEEGNTCIRVTG